MMEQDQIKKLCTEFRIINFLSNKESLRNLPQLRDLFEKFYYNYKILKQKKEISEEEFDQFLIKCLSIE